MLFGPPGAIPTPPLRARRHNGWGISVQAPMGPSTYGPPSIRSAPRWDRFMLTARRGGGGPVERGAGGQVQVAHEHIDHARPILLRLARKGSATSCPAAMSLELVRPTRPSRARCKVDRVAAGNVPRAVAAHSAGRVPGLQGLEK